MKIRKRYFSIFLILTIFLVSCSTVPVTGRRQLKLVPYSAMLSMSYQQYSQFLETNKLSENKRKKNMVNRVGVKIQKAVESYLASQNMTEKIKDYDWEFNLIENSEPNAWAMPGGKVVVYTGILPITKDETGLAVVMGHEIAHAIAEHGRERFSQGLIANIGSVALQAAVQNKPVKTKEAWMKAFGLGAQFGAILPFSRLQESEADHLGLIFMAMAGYNPNSAIGFWTRMSESKGTEAPPEFMSTHPSDETRIRKINETIPMAMEYYKK